MDFVRFVIDAGYPYELAGLVYFLFYLSMSRGPAKERYSDRSKIFTLIASMVLVGSVPFHYASGPLGGALMLAVLAVSLWSTFRDRRTPPAA